jgi:hypothetical protein
MMGVLPLGSATRVSVTAMLRMLITATPILPGVLREKAQYFLRSEGASKYLWRLFVPGSKK